MSTFFTGDSKRDFNPTLYRSEAQYTHLVSSLEVEAPQGQKFGFDVVLKKKVQTYVEVLQIILKAQITFRMTPKIVFKSSFPLFIILF